MMFGNGQTLKMSVKEEEHNLWGSCRGFPCSWCWLGYLVPLLPPPLFSYSHPTPQEIFHKKSLMLFIKENPWYFLNFIHIPTMFSFCFSLLLSCWVYFLRFCINFANFVRTFTIEFSFCLRFFVISVCVCVCGGLNVKLSTLIFD